MIITLISGILAFLTGFAPDLIKYFMNRQDQKMELERMKLQREMAKDGATYRMNEIEAQADIEEMKTIRQPLSSFGPQILDKAHASGMGAWAVVPAFWGYTLLDIITGFVRPGVTYLVVGFYVYVKYATYKIALTYNEYAYGAAKEAWSADDFQILIMVIGFWFGQRTAKARFGGTAMNAAAAR